MASDKRIRGPSIRVTGRVGEIIGLPAGLPAALRRVWRFARDTARRFSRHLLKDRTEEFLKTVRKDFEQPI